MKITSRPLLTIALLALTASVARGESPGGGSVTFNFDGDRPDEPPAGFEFARTGKGTEGKWVVRQLQDWPGKHVLVQESADPTDYRFPLAVVSTDHVHLTTIPADGCRSEVAHGEVGVRDPSAVGSARDSICRKATFKFNANGSQRGVAKIFRAMQRFRWFNVDDRCRP